ncbi:MAG: 2-succinylbenzoate--CoA ligase [Mastigocoleus sp.]
MVEADLYNLTNLISHLKHFRLTCGNRENYINHQLFQLFQKFSLEIEEFNQISTNTDIPPKIILVESEPITFIAGFLAAVINNCPVFLCNPNWGNQEKQQVLNLVKPQIIWGSWEYSSKGSDSKRSKLTKLLPSNLSPIMIPTGGSSGKIKFAIHTWETLNASVKGFIDYFGIKEVNSLCVLPLYHVSGLMQFIRCFTTGGNLIVMPFKQLENIDFSSKNSIHYYINPCELFLSLVPTQLQRLLQNPNYHQWLSHFKTILLGGAPAWEELLQKARYYNIPVAPTYGMTETASQIATLKPDDFLSNKTGCGKILPHAQVSINHQNGKINIRATSLFLGYYSQFEKDLGEPDLLDKVLDKRLNKQSLDNNILEVDDIGFLDEDDYLHILGRSSDKIISGGEKVYPIEVEAAIRNTGMVKDVCVIGLKDKNWGEAVTAIITPNKLKTYLDKHKNQLVHNQLINSQLVNQLIKNLDKQLRHQLSKYKIPKHWIIVSSLPRNLQGKVNRQELNEIVNKYKLSTSREISR